MSEQTTGVSIAQRRSVVDRSGVRMIRRTGGAPAADTCSMCSRRSGMRLTAVVSDEPLIGSWNPLNGRREIGFVWHFLPSHQLLIADDCQFYRMTAGRGAASSRHPLRGKELALFPLMLAQADAGAATVLVDELDAAALNVTFVVIGVICEIGRLRQSRSLQ